MKILNEGITAPKGFKAAGIHCGIKKAKKDLALIVSEVPATSAGAYTKNKVKAAPVIWDQKVSDSGNPVQAIIINSGNANACTGEQGMRDSTAMAAETAEHLSSLSGFESVNQESVYVCSTGVIGVPLPMQQISKGIGDICTHLDNAKQAASDAAQAILTTDTFAKEVSVEITIDSKPVRIAGFAKGSGMIHPDMATMLSFIVTDAAVSAETLKQMLGSSVEQSYNMISVDGDTSTNDTVLVLANGASGIGPIDLDTPEGSEFKRAFDYVHTTLAKLIVKDGEGAGKFITAHVSGAKTDEDAKLAAKSIITSSLVKTAFFGQDANWGRILCAVGYSKADIDPDTISLKISSAAGTIDLLEQGTPIAFDEKQALEILKESEITVDVLLGDEYSCEATAWGCDLSYEYVKINGEYRT
jgi:glutamate N-acetyltransferase/amino-acid N-acetyltransferase